MNEWCDVDEYEIILASQPPYNQIHEVKACERRGSQDEKVGTTKQSYLLFSCSPYDFSASTSLIHLRWQQSFLRVRGRRLFPKQIGMLIQRCCCDILILIAANGSHR